MTEAANTKRGKAKTPPGVTPPAPPTNDPRVGKTLFLSKEEKLELQNIGLRRQILESQSSQLGKENDELIDAINKRIGDDIGDYSVNITTGECVFSPQFAARNAQQKAMRAPKGPKPTPDKKAGPRPTSNMKEE